MINDVLHAALDKILAVPCEKALSIANEAVDALYGEYELGKHSVQEFEHLMDAEQLLHKAVRLRMDDAYEKAYREVRRIKADKKLPTSDADRLLSQLDRVVIFCEWNGLFDNEAFGDDEDGQTLNEIVQETFSELLGSKAKKGT